MSVRVYSVVHRDAVEAVGACIYLYVVVRKVFVNSCIYSCVVLYIVHCFLVVEANLVGGVVGVVERLALSSGAFQPPKMLFLYIVNCT